MIMRLSSILLLFCTAVLSNCSEEEVKVDLNEPLVHTNEPTKWWILTHPSGGNPGIYLYDEVNAKVDLSFNLPEDIISPHALDFDGKSLWLGGMGDNQYIYEISPIDGSVLSKIPNIQAQGIAIVGDEIYYSQWSQLFSIKKDGVKLDSFMVNSNAIVDIAIHNSSVYIAVNGATDPIILFDKKTGEMKDLFDTEVIGLSTLTTYDNYFVVVDDAFQIVRIDIGTHEVISRSSIKMPWSWITAITPYNVNK